MSFESQVAPAVNLVAIIAAPAEPPLLFYVTESPHVRSIVSGIPARRRGLLQKVNQTVKHLSHMFLLYYPRSFGIAVTYLLCNFLYCLLLFVFMVQCICWRRLGRVDKMNCKTGFITMMHRLSEIFISHQREGSYFCF